MGQYILIVEDDPVQGRILEEMIGRLGFETMTVQNGHAAMELLDSPRAERLDAILLDLAMPECDGMDVLAHMERKGLQVPVIVQTAQDSTETVVKAMRAGADDFVVKPVSPKRLKVSLQNLLKVNVLATEVKRLQKKVDGVLTFDDLIAASPSMANVKRLGRRAAQSDIPVLIEGEAGVGREIIAHAIQGESERRGHPLITVNCGAVPENLLESILFGHERDSLPGAAAGHAGKFREANGGTLFLDEVGELPLDMQARLLRAVQEGEIDPVGTKHPVAVDVRLICATDRNMIEMVKEGRFREDLYYRLNVCPIMVPPLRERPEDIPGLVEHFIARFAAEEGRKVRGIEADAAAMLRDYEWPGNVRQLENAVFRAVVLCEGDALSVVDFPQIAALVDGYEAEIPPLPAVPVAARIGGPAMIGTEPSRTATAPGLVADGIGFGIPAVTEGGHIRRLEDVEGDMIRLALDRYRGHMSEVARKLGIGRSTLYRKVRDLGLEDPQGEARAMSG